MTENDFGQDVEFLKQHVETIVLTNSECAQIAIVPAYQGRTMTSSSQGDRGSSFGYVNYEQIASQRHDPQINLYGGEDRMWISPEGGQFSVFFDPGVEMCFDNWRTPPVLDTEAFETVEQTDHSLSLTRQATLRNWSGFEFQIQMDRQVRLLDRMLANGHLGNALDAVPSDSISLVAHESHNTLTNIGSETWSPETGLIGIWMLCMNKPASGATLVVPFRPGPESTLGKIVNADYFGKLDSSRLVIEESVDPKNPDQPGLIYFHGDGNLRSKLGLTFQRVCPSLGSWDRQRGILSLVQFNLPDDAPHGYNNNLWAHQDNPYAGDVINCYNDGPNESGGQLGGFFELETISPALALKPRQSYTHLHRTIRMEGQRESLSTVARQLFGVGLDQIESHFG